jgi:outer membrane protein TolC
MFIRICRKLVPARVPRSFPDGSNGSNGLNRAFAQLRDSVLFASLAAWSLSARAQTSADSVQDLTLGQCVDYALKHRPTVQQSLIGINLARTSNAINLAGWLPQAYLSGNLTHYITLPTSFVTDSAGKPTPQHTGVVNSALPVFSVTQALFSPALLYAAKTVNLYVKQAEQITDSTKIGVIANVSKSFYNLLQTLKQIDVLREDTSRLTKNQSDTYHQYIAGTVDETDYDEATITLNNSKAQLVQEEQNVLPQYAALKQAMGYPPLKQFNVQYDTLQMMQDIVFDTTQQLQFERRIEYQQLETTLSLQHQQTNYYRNAFLPTVSAFYNYDFEFESNASSSLFANSYPYSYLGLSLSLPIFTGFSRLNNIRRSEMLERIVALGQSSLRSAIYTEYTTALANYKANWYNFNIMKDNVVLAKKTYAIVALQYLQGIVPYLNVITAESNLITSEIGFTNALFLLLSSKIDLELAMGFITVHP